MNASISDFILKIYLTLAVTVIFSGLWLVFTYYNSDNPLIMWLEKILPYIQIITIGIAFAAGFVGILVYIWR